MNFSRATRSSENLNRNFFYNGYSVQDTVIVLATFSTLFSGYGFFGNSIIGIVLSTCAILISLDKLKFSMSNYLTIAAALFYFVIVIANSADQLVAMQNIRFWHGVILYIILFKSRFKDVLTSFLVLRILFSLVIIESILINTVVDSSIIHPESNELRVSILGYERPLSFAGNPGMSGVSLIALFYFTELRLRVRASRSDLVVLVIVSLAFASSTVLFILVLFFVFRLIGKVRLKSLITMVFFLSLVFYVLNRVDYEVAQRFSIDYFYVIYENKLNQWMSFSSSGEQYKFFGTQLTDEAPVTSGDFGWLLFLNTMGVAGILLYFAIVLSFYNGGFKYFPVLLLILIGSSHYPAAMSPAGQLITAMILVLPAYRLVPITVRAFDYGTSEKLA